MRRLGFAILSLCLTVVPSALAEDWSKDFSISGKPSLRVETSDANIQVSTWDKNTIQTQVTTKGWKIGEGGITIIDHQAGDAVELEVRFPRETFGFGARLNRRVDIAIVMPREGQVNLHTGDGAINLKDFQGDMKVDSGDGRLEINSVSGSLHAHTGDGRIDVNGRFDKLEVATGDGHVEARALPGSSVGAGWRLQSGDGAISLAIPQDLAADVDLQTGDGRITLDLPISVEGHLRESNIRGKLNGGGGTLTIQTGDGSIHLEKTSSL